MKKILWSVTLSLVVQCAVSQTVTEIPLRSSRTADLQLLPAGNKLYVSFTESLNEFSFPRAYWIDENKAELAKHTPNLLALLPDTTGLTGYYHTEKNIIRCFREDQSGVRNQKELRLAIEGEIVLTFIDTGLYVLSYDKKSLTLFLYKLDGAATVVVRKFTLTEQWGTLFKKSEKIDFIRENSLLNSFEGESKLKLYWGRDQFFATYDNFIEESKTHSVNLLDFSLAEETTAERSLLIQEPGEFRSFIFDNKIYLYFLSNKRFKIDVLDFKTLAPLHSSSIERSDTLNIPLYNRFGKEHTISKSELKSLFLFKTAGMRNNLLTVFKSDSTFYALCGSYYNSKGFVGPYGMSASPLVGLLVMTIGTTMKQAFAESTDSRVYHYMSSSDGIHFNVNRNATHVRQKLDDWEILQQIKKRKATYKTYIQVNNTLLGVYQFRKEKKIFIVAF